MGLLSIHSIVLLKKKENETKHKLESSTLIAFWCPIKVVRWYGSDDGREDTSSWVKMDLWEGLW